MLAVRVPVLPGLPVLPDCPHRHQEDVAARLPGAQALQALGQGAPVVQSPTGAFTCNTEQYSTVQCREERTVPRLIVIWGSSWSLLWQLFISDLKHDDSFSLPTLSLSLPWFPAVLDVLGAGGVVLRVLRDLVGTTQHSRTHGGMGGRPVEEPDK